MLVLLKMVGVEEVVVLHRLEELVVEVVVYCLHWLLEP
jgi:hypothetical protein